VTGSSAQEVLNLLEFRLKILEFRVRVMSSPAVGKWQLGIGDNVDNVTDPEAVITFHGWDIGGAIWWAVMVAASLFNIGLLSYVFMSRNLCKGDPKCYGWQSRCHGVHGNSTWMDGAAVLFTIVCAYRSVWPRIDAAPRTCWFDTVFDNF
jgi:hypothetical protein